MDKLAQDAAAALAAGMSYGKWKSLHPQIAEEKPETEKIPDGWRTCRYCGKPMDPSKCRNSQRYCNLECRSAKERERNRYRMRERCQSQASKRREEAAKQECIDNAERVRQWEENRKKVKNESFIG